jgi:hypothetical protein
VGPDPSVWDSRTSTEPGRAARSRSWRCNRHGRTPGGAQPDIPDRETHRRRRRPFSPNVVSVRRVACPQRYLPRGGPRELYADPSLARGEVATLSAAIERAILTEAGNDVARAVVFAAQPIAGFWCYRNLFQILPPPPGAPRAEGFLMAKDPVVLELSYEKSPDALVTATRTSRAQRELQLLLGVFLRSPLTSIQMRPRRATTSAIRAQS